MSSALCWLDGFCSVECRVSPRKPILGTMQWYIFFKLRGFISIPKRSFSEIWLRGLWELFFLSLFIYAIRSFLWIYVFIIVVKPHPIIEAFYASSVNSVIGIGRIEFGWLLPNNCSNWVIKNVQIGGLLPVKGNLMTKKNLDCQCFTQCTYLTQNPLLPFWWTDKEFHLQILYTYKCLFYIAVGKIHVAFAIRLHLLLRYYLIYLMMKCHLHKGEVIKICHIEIAIYRLK